MRVNLLFSYLYYDDHSRAPWFHSWNRPKRRIIIKNNDVINQFIKWDDLIIGMIGKIKAISTSKIRKIIVIKKNRSENGIREELLGSNPHSKGEFFSRS